MKNFYAGIPIEFFSRSQIDAAKGFLILSVIIGHLRSLSGVNHEIFQFVYNYHVVGFLILPFLYPIKTVNKTQIMTWLARYYVPFTAFFLLYSVLSITILGTNFNPLTFIKGYFIATPEMIDRATGSSILWFLPHIFLVMLVVSLVFKKVRIPLMALLIVSFILHGMIGFLPRETAFEIPFTASNLFYLFFLGVITRLLVMILKETGFRYGWVFFVLFIGLQIASLTTQKVLGYTGIWIPSFLDTPKLLLIDLLIVNGMLFMLYFKPLGRIKPLIWMGKHSLIIFLIHQPFLYLTWQILERTNGTANSSNNVILYGSISFVSALFFSIIGVLILYRLHVLKRIIFPRSFADWRA